MSNTTKLSHRFKAEDRVFCRRLEEVLHIQRLTQVNGQPAYVFWDHPAIILDQYCSKPAVPCNMMEI